MAGTENNWQDCAHNYRAFLLRCWQEEGPESEREPVDSFVWRFALVQLDDDSQMKGFVCLEDLFGYLHGELIQGRSPAAGSKLPHLDVSIKKDENAS